MSEIKPEILKVDDGGVETSSDGKGPDNNLTISTKASTDQLICKTPRGSPSSSVIKGVTATLGDVKENGCCSVALYLGLMQILFGLLMCTFGILVIMHDASLSQIGGGLWGGCLAVGAGTAGILAAAKNWCPLRTGAQKIAQTISLALSLVALAIAQLVLVLAATGLARDVQKSEIIEISTQAASPEDIVEVLPSNYPALLSNIGLVVICAIECVIAAVASYKGARAICPCFKSNEENLYYNSKTNGSDSLVSSWLGNHTAPPHIYLVHAPSTLGKHSKISGGLPVAPIFALSQHMAPTMYPLIPAPLGAVPSPIIQHAPRDMSRNYRRYLRDKPMPAQHQSHHTKSRTRSKSKEKPMTEEDVARTYTGLDRTIAEEFIEICDSRNNSMCSDSSCRSSCQCSQSGCTGCTGCTSDLGSRDYLIDKI